MKKVVAATVLAGSILIGGPANGAELGVLCTHDKTPPCATEDSNGRCVWDARHMGNGSGFSFIARPDGSINFIFHKRAHRLMTTCR